MMLALHSCSYYHVSMKTHVIDYDLNEPEPQERDSLMFTLGTLPGDRHEIFQWIADMMSFQSSGKYSLVSMGTSVS